VNLHTMSCTAVNVNLFEQMRVQALALIQTQTSHCLMLRILEHCRG
jgi:hypothetical protein